MITHRTVLHVLYDLLFSVFPEFPAKENFYKSAIVHFFLCFTAKLSCVSLISMSFVNSPLKFCSSMRDRNLPMNAV